MSRPTRHIRIYFISIVALLGSLLLSACGPSIPRPQAEQELGAAVLDYLVAQQFSGSATYRRMAGQPWSNAPQDVIFMVWAPANKKFNEQGIEYLDSNKPLRVWWLAGSDLVEVTSDKAAAVQDYRNTRITHRPADARWGWNYYEFGILSMSNGNQKAKVYVGNSCGPLCGTGTIYTLERDATGKWTIRDSEMRWIS